MTAGWIVRRWPLDHARAGGAAGELLALLAHPFPYTLRPAVGAGGGLELRACVSDELPGAAGRLAWLDRLAVTLDAAPQERTDPAPALDLVGTLAAARGWTVIRADGGELRLSVAGELDDPPLIARADAAGVLIERVLPLLPAPTAPDAVRRATAHAALRANALVRGARLAVRDTCALTLAAEARMPPGDLDEDEAGLLMDGVRHALRACAPLFDCLRNPAVAAEYGAAHNLPTERSGT